MRRAGISFKGRVGTRGSSLEGKVPDEVNWKAHNYNHLLEPTIFYSIVIALVLMGFDNEINVYLAWAYVGLRIAHSLVRATVNIVIYRFWLFILRRLVPLGPYDARRSEALPRLILPGATFPERWIEDQPTRGPRSA